MDDAVQYVGIIRRYVGTLNPRAGIYSSSGKASRVC